VLRCVKYRFLPTFLKKMDLLGFGGGVHHIPLPTGLRSAQRFKAQNNEYRKCAEKYDRDGKAMYYGYRQNTEKNNHRF
jgi:hypothetical protein